MNKAKIKKLLKKKNGVLILVIILLPTIANTYFQEKIPLEKTSEVTLAKCVDGDTARLIVDGQEEVVRFLAVDTPETVKPNTEVQPYGKEASEYTCGALSSANEIYLEYESERKDKYDRTLGWVWADGVLLQQSLIEKGLAKVAYIYGDYKYTDQLYAAENFVKESKIGIWK